MKANELIKELSELVKKYGDHEVLCNIYHDPEFSEENNQHDIEDVFDGVEHHKVTVCYLTGDKEYLIPYFQLNLNCSDSDYIKKQIYNICSN